MSAIDRPLKLGPEPLNGVRVDRAAHVFAAAMVHSPVLEAEPLGVAVGGKLVRVERGSRLHVVPEVAKNLGVCETAHDKRAVMCADCAYTLSEPVTTTGRPPEPSELDRIRAEVAKLDMDKQQLLSAIETLRRAKGRHNTGIAYERLMEVAGKVEAGVSSGQVEESK